MKGLTTAKPSKVAQNFFFRSKHIHPRGLNICFSGTFFGAPVWNYLWIWPCSYQLSGSFLALEVSKMARTQYFDLQFSNNNAQKYFVSSRRHDFNQNICSYLHLETCWQDKAGHTNNHAESSERELITSCCGCSYLLFLFFVTWKFKGRNLLKINLQNLKVGNFLEKYSGMTWDKVKTRGNIYSSTYLMFVGVLTIFQPIFIYFG